MVPARVAQFVLVSLAVLAIWLVLEIALPFATSIFVAAVVAGALAPVMDRLAAGMKGRKRAAAVITVAVVVAVLGPMSALAVVLVPQAVQGVAWLRGALQTHALEGLVRRVPEALRPVAERLERELPSSLERLQDIIGAEGARAAGIAAKFLSATGSILFQTVLMLVALYFLLVDGPSLVAWLNDAIPLKRGQLSELLRDFRRVTVTVLVSTIATAGVQSALALVGYLIAGVPNAVFFAFTTFFLALVPFVGATVVVLALAILKLATGQLGHGLFLAGYAIGVVAMVDNVLKPVFIRGGVPIHGAVIFFALFGGLAAFGPVGFLVGPLAVSFMVAIERMYRRDYGG